MQHKKRHILEYFLFPFTLLYSMVVSIRNKLFDLNILRSQSFDTPVISVGNLAVGGTGKTPHVEYLASLLKGQFNIAVLSRGYKRKTKNFLIANQSMDHMQTGDESLQIKLKFPDITVAVDRKRVNGINVLSEQHKPDVILLDDAYQHRYVQPGLSILLTDYNRPFYNDYLMPFGRLREKRYESRRANIIIVTKTPENITPIEKRIVKKNIKLYPFQDMFFTTLDYDEMRPVFEHGEEKLTKEKCKNEKYNILIVSGIADPRQFKKHIRGISTKIRQVRFTDHHTFSKKDVKHIEQKYNALEPEKRIIITTEKDAIRLQTADVPEALKPAFYYIPVKVKFISKQDKFNDIIYRFAKEKKRNSPLFR